MTATKLRPLHIEDMTTKHKTNIRQEVIDRIRDLIANDQWIPLGGEIHDTHTFKGEPLGDSCGCFLGAAAKLYLDDHPGYGHLHGAVFNANGDPATRDKDYSFLPTDILKWMAPDGWPRTEEVLPIYSSDLRSIDDERDDAVIWRYFDKFMQSRTDYQCPDRASLKQAGLAFCDSLEGV